METGRIKRWRGNDKGVEGASMQAVYDGNFTIKNLLEVMTGGQWHGAHKSLTGKTVV